MTATQQLQTLRFGLQVCHTLHVIFFYLVDYKLRAFTPTPVPRNCDLRRNHSYDGSAENQRCWPQTFQRCRAPDGQQTGRAGFLHWAILDHGCMSGRALVLGHWQPQICERIAHLLMLLESRGSHKGTVQLKPRNGAGNSPQDPGHRATSRTAGWRVGL